MMGTGETRKFVSLFGGARESSDLVGIARAACREGYAVIAVKPLTKEPICTLTDRQRAAADREAAHTARNAGSKHWERKRHPCGRSHAITDPAMAERVFKRLVAKHPDLNIGLEVGASRMLVLDADTAAERESFTALWAQMEEVPELANAAPTVRSPGVRRADSDADGDEVWTHKDGGHYWFQLPPEVDFAHACTSAPLKLGAHAAKASLMFRDQLVLVPPSVRAEGPYVMASDIQPAPAWMIAELHAHLAKHAEKIDRHRERVGNGDDQVEVWASRITWDSILTRYGWTTSGRTDQCGCEIWTRPGDWSSPKSATAHEPGCELRDVVGGVLHLWTDAPPEELAGRRNWSKLQVVAAYEHGGDVKDAMSTIGLLSASTALPAVGPSLNGSAPAAPPHPGDDQDDEDLDEEDVTSSWAPVDMGALWDGAHEQRTPEVLRRTDGVGMFYAGLTHSVHGESESGKSWLGQSGAVEVLAAGGRVLYVDFEDRGPEVLPRLRALGLERTQLGRLTYITPEGPADATFARMIEANNYDLAVIDGVTAAMGEYRLKSNAQDDVAQWHKLLPRWVADTTGAAVVVIDHVSKSKDDRGRFAIGSQAKMAALSGSGFYVDVARGLAPGSVGELRILVGKDRPGGVRANAGKMQRDRLQPFARYIHDATDPEHVRAELVPWVEEDVVAVGELRPMPRGADWASPDQPDVPVDVASFSGDGQKAIQDLARFLRTNATGMIGMNATDAVTALRSIKGPDGKPVHSANTIKRAWDAMINELGRLEPAETNVTDEGVTKNPRGLHLWVEKVSDPGVGS